MSEKQLLIEDFRDRVGSVFTLSVEGIPPIQLTLESAQPLPLNFSPPGARPPFSLMFIGGGEIVLPQAIYPMTHDDMGEVAIFLVPIAKDARGISYQATFN